MGACRYLTYGKCAPYRSGSAAPLRGSGGDGKDRHAAQRTRMNTAMPSHVERREDDLNRLPPAPTVYLTIVAAAAAAVALPAFAGFHTGSHDWRDFAIFTIAAATAQVFKVETTRNQSMHAALVF